MMYIVLSIFGLLLIGIAVYLQSPLFGAAPKGERLTSMQRSPNYKDGAFQNIEPTLATTEDVGIVDRLREVFFGVDKDAKPKDSIPSVDINLHELDLTENVLVWLGHSSYYLQVDGVKMIIDPVFSNNASPVSGSAKAFKGADLIKAADIPIIDYLVITHDHYDHLDYRTVKELNIKSNQVIAPLGVGTHLEYWGYDSEKITELDWGDSLNLKNKLKITSTTARHGSGRKFNRNNTLWTSYILEASSQRLFLGGDSGYGKHFKEIGDQNGSFDLAILENGQYNRLWKYTHMFPEQVLQAADDLQAKRLMPVHSGKFNLSSHAWYEPLREISRINNLKNEIPLVTPIIGEIVFLKDSTQVFKPWFE